MRKGSITILQSMLFAIFLPEFQKNVKAPDMCLRREFPQVGHFMIHYETK